MTKFISRSGWASMLVMWLSLSSGPVGSAAIAPPEPLPTERAIAPGLFQPTWDSLTANYQCPEWFRDAKLGIWAHWGPQCVPEQGDWYARAMYVQGHRQNLSHVATYGHPSEFGFMEITHLWKADEWNPEELMQLYVDAGARYFVAMANHEDNFDNFASRYHAWNTVNVGPKRDIVGTWAKVARAKGLRFGVSNHSSHAWHWFQTAYGYDAEGEKAGIRYDAHRLRKEDGKGKWWDGLDPQDLYGKPSLVIPDGITTMAAAKAWHDANNLPWTEEPPPNDPRFVELWFHRLKDLIDQYRPDFVYLDNTELPLGQAGLDIAAHYYNANMSWNGGKLDAVLTAKGLREERRAAVVQDHERSGGGGGIQPYPFETGTCIGQWHYQKGLEYKSVGTIVRMLVDVVSKNGTLLLSIPQRGDGTIDKRERAFLQGLTAWTQVNGEGIFGSRPWKTFGEGPTQVPRGRAGDGVIPYTQEDIRFTSKDGHLYLFVLQTPSRDVSVKSLGRTAEFGQAIRSISLVGSNAPVRWQQHEQELVIEKPAQFPSADVVSFQITFQ
jgi:alpha-L-fucosidase